MNRKTLAGVLAVGLTLAAAPAMADEALAKEKGCTACHGIDKKILGPAYNDVSKKYKGDKAAPAMLVQKVMKGGKDTWGPIPMPANDKLSEADAKKLVAWVLSIPPAK